MALHIIKGDRNEQERKVHRYMQEIRDIARGGFNRRELLKMGLVLGGAGLIELAGMPNFRPFWAHADDSIPFRSPRNPPNALTSSTLKQPSVSSIRSTPVKTRPKWRAARTAIASVSGARAAFS